MKGNLAGVLATPFTGNYKPARDIAISSHHGQAAKVANSDYQILNAIYDDE
jgi:hypothetical protein